MANIAERVSITETQLEVVEKRFDKFENKFEKLEEKFNVLSTKFDVIDVKVSDIHERLQRQNGAIPHLQHDVNQILLSLNQHIQDEDANIKEVIEKLTPKKDTSTLTGLKTKVSILWAAGSAIALAILGIAVKVLFE
jgi:chromosome segregation ATPase